MRFLFAILSISPTLLFAQYESQLGRFSIDYAEACSPVTISVSKHDDFGDISRQYFYEPGLIETLDTFHTYTKAGVYQIVQFIGEDIYPKTDTLIFTVHDADPPTFNIFQCSSTEVVVHMTDTTYDYFKIKFSDTDSVFWHQGDTYPSYDFGRMNGTVQVFGYLNDAYPTCPDISRSFNLTDKFNVQLNDAKISEVCLNDYYLTLHIEEIVSTFEYQVTIQQGNQNEFSVFQGPLTDTVSVFPLDQFNASEKYCVNLKIINPCTSTPVKNSQKCGDNTHSVYSLDNAYASYSGSNIKLNIDTSLVGSVNIYRKPVGGQYTEIANISKDLVDNVPSSYRQYIYRLSLEDSCSNKIDSIEVNAPYIKLLNRGIRDNSVSLELNDPGNNLQEIGRTLWLYNGDSTIYKSVDLSSDFIIPNEIGETINIRSRYIYEDSIMVYSNKVSTYYKFIVYVPTAFTPNGDGLNDYLEIFGLPTTEYKMFIFDRWGKVIQLTENNPVWDGIVSGKKAPSGPYTYKLEFKLENGELKTQVGTFTLLRN